MSTPEQPATPPLTRKQMREIRNTGSNPIITTEAAPDEATVQTPEPEPATVVFTPLPRAAEPVVIPEAPMADAAVDLGVSPLTRRQARQQERIRTASVPVITPEVAAAHAVSIAPVSVPVPVSAIPLGVGAADQMPTGLHELFASSQPAVAPATDVEDQQKPDAAHDVSSSSGEQADGESDSAADDTEPDRAVVNPLFGVALLESEPTHVELPPSFDQLLARSSSGSLGTSNALIISQASSASPIVAPVNATGEVLITGTLNLPEGLGSNGHAPGAADGKEVDAVLIDGELPAHSSPTPIAASAAISTVKNSGEIIKPPAPEKGSKLMMSLAITAGVLALALVGVLILAFVTGVF